MKLNPAHGAAAENGTLVVLEDEPLAEKPHAPAVGADPLVTGRDARKRVRTTAAAQALAKLPRQKTFRPRDIEVTEAFRYYYHQRLGWLDQRIKDLTQQTGGCSAAVTMRLRRAAWAYAWAEYADATAAKDGDLDRAEQAARLSEKADKLDWSAWTMACREGEARPQLSGRERLEARMVALRAADEKGNK